jgi:Ras-related protein Rab-2A
MLFLETSAKSAHNVDNAFVSLAENIFEKIENNEIEINNENNGIKTLMSSFNSFG